MIDASNDKRPERFGLQKPTRAFGPPLYSQANEIVTVENKSGTGRPFVFWTSELLLQQ
jgi:hypothetical protein